MPNHVFSSELELFLFQIGFLAESLAIRGRWRRPFKRLRTPTCLQEKQERNHISCKSPVVPEEKKVEGSSSLKVLLQGDVMPSNSKEYRKLPQELLDTPVTTTTTKPNGDPTT
jgi:hypothetical protein